MQIEFDPAKNAANIKSRGLSFESTGEFDFAAADIEQDTPQGVPRVSAGGGGFSGPAPACAVLHAAAFGYSGYQFSQGQQTRGKRL